MSAQIKVFSEIKEHAPLPARPVWQSAQTTDARPVLILTIANGAGHTRAAQAVAEAIKRNEPASQTIIVDVADYMNASARFTHITAYLWLVKHAPAVWERIDRYQKRQPHTSPAWYYRRGCRRLFNLARTLQLRALIATEVGCCEIAALIKRDLKLRVPLVAVNINYDADRAWIQPEVDLYTVMTGEYGAALARQGAPTARIAVWGAPLTVGFNDLCRTSNDRAAVCSWLELDEHRPIILLAGGSEGLGQLEATFSRLLRDADHKPQLILLCGRNEKLKRRCERLALQASDKQKKRVRVLGWIEDFPMPVLMRAADLLISKLGNAFDEAIAAELPLIALEPPPGSERAQYELLGNWGTGRAVRTLDELLATVKQLLADERECARMRANARARKHTDAASRLARWLADDKNATNQLKEKQ